MIKRFYVTALCFFLPISAWAESYSFGILPHRSAVLTAQYWNPILDYVSKKSGVTLELVTRKTSQEFSDLGATGKFDFVYDSHIFAPSHAAAAYRVIARMVGQPIHGQIVVPETSPIHSINELEGKEVGFANKLGPIGYASPMSALLKAGIQITPVFGGNQEGIMGQLRSGTVLAAGVNSRVMKEYAAREQFKYRSLWTSEELPDLPIAAHPRVPTQVINAVQTALTGMAANPEGLKILKKSAAVIKQEPPLGFVTANDSEYQHYRAAYRAIQPKETH